jgi:hypothetical protein
MAIHVLGGDDPLYTAEEMAEREGICPRTWHRWRKLNQVPKPIYIGRVPYWRAATRREQLLAQEAGQ